MKAPALPVNEKERLTTLHSLKILDTLPSERFDRITRMAKRIFNVPIALVSLVDKDRQWFKSCVGLDVAETPRNISFCGHAILQDDVFMVADATQDQRFANNPLVSGEPNIRFYAGQPIKASNSHVMGTLCIIDASPRTLNSYEIDMLKDLGNMAEEQLHFEEASTQDELTRLKNYRGFISSGEQNLQLSRRHGLPLTLVYIDLDHFKAISKSHGYEEGNQVLLRFSKYLKRCSRASDIIGRLSEDEFVALLINTTENLAANYVDHLQDAINKHNKEEEREGLIFSHQIVQFDQARHTTIEDMITEGDALTHKLQIHKPEK